MDTGILHYKLATAYSNLRNYLGDVGAIVMKDAKLLTIKDNVYVIEPVPGQENTFVVAPPKSAIFQVARAMEMGLDDPDIRFLRANIFLGAGLFDKAYPLYKEIEDKYGLDDKGKPKAEEKALFYHQFAEAAFGMGQYDEFLKLTQQAVDLQPGTYKPSLVDAYLRVANCKSQAGDQQGYIDFLKKVIELKPDVASYHLLLGDAYRDAKDYPNAVMHWKLVLELEPDRPDRIEILNMIDQYSKAK
jgi:tetratricopeptide (TPR) repeat protein